MAAWPVRAGRSTPCTATLDGGFSRFDPGTGSWTPRAPLLDPAGSGKGLCVDPGISPCTNLAAGADGTLSLLGLQAAAVGVGATVGKPVVRAVAAPDAADTYVGGTFTTAIAASSVSGVGNVARWDQAHSTWAPLAGGVRCTVTPTPPDACVLALAVGADRQHVYVGGRFDQVVDAGGTASAATGFAVYNVVSNSWTIPPAFTTTAPHYVTGIAVHAGSGAETVYVGGEFAAPTNGSPATVHDLVTYDHAATVFVPLGPSDVFPTSNYPAGTSVHALAVSAAGRVYASIGPLQFTQAKGSSGGDAVYRIDSGSDARFLGETSGVGTISAIAPLDDTSVASSSDAAVAIGGLFSSLEWLDDREEHAQTSINNLAVFRQNPDPTNQGNSSNNYARWYGFGGDDLSQFYSGTNVPGVDGQVRGMVWIGSDLYMVGDFHNLTYHLDCSANPSSCPPGGPYYTTAAQRVATWTGATVGGVAALVPQALPKASGGGVADNNCALGVTAPCVLAVDGNVGSGAYIGGAFATVGGQPAANFARWNTSLKPPAWDTHASAIGLFQYSPSGNSWQQVSNQEAPFAIGPGAALTGFPTTGGSDLFALSTDGSAWLHGSAGWSSADSQASPSLPTVCGCKTGLGASLAATTGDGSPVFALLGRSSPKFAEYLQGSSTSANTPHGWTMLANAPFDAGAGASLAWDGGTYIYAMQGGGNRGFARYDITTKQWGATFAAATGFDVGQGAGIAPDATGQYLYATEGTGSLGFHRYGPLHPAAPVKLTVDQSAFVGIDPSTTYAWTNLGKQLPDFTVSGSGNVWVGGASWTPGSPDAPLTPATTSLASAHFLDPQHNVFRVGTGSALAAGNLGPAGYYTPTPDAYVSPGYCPSCANDGLIWGLTAFSSIQAALYGGAQHVYALPGQYPEAVHLLAGSQVLGSGADLTEIRPPAGVASGALVSAEGIADATLRGVSLAGGGTFAGARAVAGASGITFSRDIIRQTTTAIGLDGPSTSATIVNDTITGNGLGIDATNCAALDVRNTVFASTAGAGLRYQANCPNQLVRYNDYYQNNPDVSDGTGNPPLGAGSIGVDPAFTDAGAGDYRPLPGSPLIGAGDPSDPSPPGSGGRVDIGYVQASRASAYVSQAYCATCENDGLTWQVDAFGGIPQALLAAARQLAALGCASADCVPQFSVGVAPGTYAVPTGSTIRIPSHVSLVGSGGDVTTLQGDGSGAVVTIDASTASTISGFHITGAGTHPGIDVGGAANGVAIDRNLIEGNGTGVRVGGGATASLHSDTITGNGGDGVAVGDTKSWASVRDTIVSGSGHDGLLASDGQIFAAYDLLFGNTNAPSEGTGVHTDDTVLTGKDPLLTGSDFHLVAGSPAIDAADPSTIVPVGGGQRADIGYRELVAPPVLLLFGKEGNSAALGNAGVGRVQVAMVPIGDPTTPVTQTAPLDSQWRDATLDPPGTAGRTAAYFTSTITPTTAGDYRIYVRATDVVGNQTADVADWYKGSFFAAGSTPAVGWVAAPSGSVTDAAVWLVAQASEYTTVGGQSTFAVRSTSFTVDGVSWPATWIDNGWTEGSGQPRSFAAAVPLSAGHHTIVARATDSAGATGTTDSVGVDVPNTAVDVATITSPRDNGSIGGQATLQVSGYARFAQTSGQSVTITATPAGGGTPATVTVSPANPGALLSAWSTAIALPAASGYTLSAVAVSGPPTGVHAVGGAASAGVASALIPFLPQAAIGSSVKISVDSVPPSIQFTAPAAGGFVSGPVTLKGTAADAGSGLAGVSLSLDNGLTWSPALLSQGGWSFDWTPPPNEDGVGRTILARATDRAGNQQQTSLALVIDNVVPAIVPVAFTTASHPDGLPLGTHLGTTETLTATWQTPTDGDGTVTALAAVDQKPDTLPSQAVTGMSISAPLGAAGAWYVHLSLVDGAGNVLTRHFGPWYVDDLTTSQAACSSRQLTILTDGVVDLAHGEWTTANNLLDYDTRTTRSQALYAAMESGALHLAWQGADWNIDGTFWAYISDGAAGTTLPVQPLPAGTLAGGGLPFAATEAISIGGTGHGTLWKWSGTTWQQAGPLVFAENGNGTEVAIPWSLPQVGTFKLLAYALGTKGSPWSVFPTTNAPAGPWTDAYSWANPCGVAAMGAAQPQTRGVTMGITSPQPPGVPLGAGSKVAYAITVRNVDPRPLSGLALALAGSSGLTYSGVSGCDACSLSGAGGTLSLPTIAVGASLTLTVSGSLAGTLTGIDSVTTTATLSAPDLGGVTLARAALTHQVDSRPPIVGFTPGQALRSGTVTITGSSSDGNGIGVSAVRVRLGKDGSWQAATGTQAWSATLTIPSGVSTADIQVEAIDGYNQSSGVLDQSLPVLSAGPSAVFALPRAVAGTITYQLGGTIQPAHAAVPATRVEVQVDDESAPWEPADGPYAADARGVQHWHYTWDLPVASGAGHLLRARATDAAGNVGPASAWQGTTVLLMSVRLGASTGAAAVGQPVVFTAQVTLPGVLRPSGTFHFTDTSSRKTRDLGTVPADPLSGVATFTAADLEVGGNLITATYSGDAQVPGSSSATYSESVHEPGAPAPTPAQVPVATIEPGQYDSVPTAFLPAATTILPAVTTTATATVTSTTTPTAEVTATAVATGTATPIRSAVRPTASSTPTTRRPAARPPSLTVYNQPHTVQGGRTRACDLARNTRGAWQRGCEIVSSISVPGARVTYTVTFPNGTVRRFTDRMDSRGHSLHPFEIAYLPPKGARHGSRPTIARVMAVVLLANGTKLGPVSLRFSILR